MGHEEGAKRLAFFIPSTTTGPFFEDREFHPGKQRTTRFQHARDGRDAFSVASGVVR